MFQGFFEDHTGRPDQKRSKYHLSDVVVFFFSILSCLTFGDGVDLDNVNICDFTPKPFSQLSLKKNEKLLMTVNQYFVICR